MKRQERKANRSEIALIVCTALLAIKGLSQSISTNDALDALSFMSSPQGTGVVNKAQILLGASTAKIAFSNELVRISNNNVIALPVRQSATEALQTYDKSATNTYQEIEMFVKRRCRLGRCQRLELQHNRFRSRQLHLGT